MEFIITEIDKDDFFLYNTIEEMKKFFDKHEGCCYIKHPLFGLSGNVEAPLVTIASPYFGLIMIDVYNFQIDNIIKIENSIWFLKDFDWHNKNIFEYGEDKISSIYGRIIANRELRKFSEKDNRLKGKYLIYLPNIEKTLFIKRFEKLNVQDIIFNHELEIFFNNIIKQFKDKIPHNIWNFFIGLLSGANVLIKPLRRPEPESTKAGIIRNVENQIQYFDIDQMKIAQQIPPGPQRIRGLAGTGKTIILTLKAVYMHLYHPEWNIIYTFNTQSLYDYIYDLIKKFYAHWSNGGEPNWNNLKILHGWGGKNKEGLYYNITNIMHKTPKSYTEAKTFFEHRQNSELLGKCCLELMTPDLPQIYDAILIDEAQDFNKNFYNFCYKLLKAPYRLIWAYDELQSLEDVNIPTAQEIFGVDKEGIPIVNLDGIYPGGIEKDFVLSKAYRNPRLILMTAHIFGMGLLRKNGAIQFLPNKGSWEDLGYKFIDGEFKENYDVIITRPKDNSPNIIEDSVPVDELLKIKPFEKKVEELMWISEQIEKDITKENLRSEDILVIGINNNDLFNHFNIIKAHLKGKKINCFIIGKDFNIDIFHIPNYITMSTVFKAKGNEAISIYIFDFEYSENKEDVIQSRNMAFASLTRTKGWATITGTGKIMVELSEEIKKIICNYPEISFKIPDITKIKRQLDNVEYEKRRSRIKKAEVAITNALRTIRETGGGTELSKKAKKEILEFAKKLENGENQNG